VSVAAIEARALDVPGGAALGSVGPAGAVAVRLIVCGDPLRGDDAVAGLAAERALEALDPALVGAIEVVRRGGLEVEDLTDLPPEAACVVVDAAVGIAPGRVVVLSLGRLAERRPGARSAGPQPRSTHAIPVETALSLAAVLRGAAPRGVFVGIGGSRFDLGAALSEPVRAALPALVGALARELERLAAPRSADPPAAGSGADGLPVPGRG
jgi:hydrogenase maturation protease